MATLYFRGTTDANWSVGTNWTGGIAPLASDDVVFDATSPNCTINAATSCRSINMSSYPSGHVLTHNAFILAVGDASGGTLDFSGAWTYNTISDSSAIVFYSTSTNNGAGWPITWGGKAPGNVIFNAVGKWVFQDNLISRSSSTILTGNFGYVILDNITFSGGCLQFISGSLKTLSINGSTIILGQGGTASILAITYTTLISDADSTITLNSLGSTDLGYAQPIYITNFLGSINFPSIQGRWAGYISGKVSITSTSPNARFALITNQTFISLATSGSVTNRLMINSDSLGIQRTLSCSGTKNISWTNFQDIAAVGATPWDLTTGVDATETVGNCLGNSGITFAPDLELLVKSHATTAALWHVNDGTNVAWTLLDGTTSSRIALPQDNVTISCDYVKRLSTNASTSPHLCANLAMSQDANTAFYVYDGGGGSHYIYGSLTLIGGVVLNARGGGNLVLAGRNKDAAGNTVTHAINVTSPYGSSSNTGITINSIGGTYTLTNGLTLTSGTNNKLTVAAGNFNPQNYQVINSEIRLNPSAFLVPTKPIATNSIISTSAGTKATIKNITGRPLTASKCYIKDIKVTGQSLYAEKSINGGSNSNVNFYPLDTRTLVKKLMIVTPELIMSAMTSGTLFRYSGGQWKETLIDDYHSGIFSRLPLMKFTSGTWIPIGTTL
jgi:hypothetical protein